MAFLAFSKDIFLLAMKFFGSLLLKILPILVLIFVLLFVFNFFIKPKQLIKYLGKNSGAKGWLLVTGAGILSSGPIYMWYPLLGDLQEKGMRRGLITTFMYARAVKIPMFPILIAYFGLKYLLLLTITIIIMAVIQGLLSEKILGELKI